MNKRTTIFMGIGFEIIGLIIGAYLLGTELENRFDGNGLYIAFSIVLAFVLWLVHVVYLLRDFTNNDPKR